MSQGGLPIGLTIGGYRHGTTEKAGNRHGARRREVVALGVRRDARRRDTAERARRQQGKRARFSFRRIPRRAGCRRPAAQHRRARAVARQGGGHAAAEADGLQVPEHGRAHIHRRRAGVWPEHVGHRLPARAQQVDRLPRDGAQPRSGHRAHGPQAEDGPDARKPRFREPMVMISERPPLGAWPTVWPSPEGPRSGVPGWPSAPAPPRARGGWLAAPND